MSNYINNNYTEINDLSQIYCNTLNTSTVINDEFNTLQGINTETNIQSQINGILNTISFGYSSGGYFSILATQNSGFFGNSYWGYSSGTNPTVNNPLVFQYAFNVIGITFTCQTVPSVSATVSIYRNGISVYTMTNINSTSNTFSNIDVGFLPGDTFNIFTVSGSGGSMIRATISCQTGGVVGAQGAQGAQGVPGITPNFTIGTITNLSSGSTPTVNLTGTTANPILNFGLVEGQQGQQGAQGAQGQKGDKGDTGGLDATSAAAIAANTAGLAALATTVAGISADVATLDTTVAGLTTDVTTINADIDALQGKTQYITTDVGTTTTQITSNFQVGTGINPSSFKVDFTTGNLENTGDITVRNNAGSSTITLSNEDGTITCNTLNCDSINVNTGIINGLTTNVSNEQKLLSNSNIIIGGANALSTITSINLNGIVYVNGIALVPFSSASSFFSQW